MFAFERKTVAEDELNFPGLISPKFSGITTLVFLALYIAFIFFADLEITQQLALIPIAILGARIVALDLSHQLILNIYSLPLLALGLFLPQLIDLVTWSSSYTALGVVIGFMLCVMGLQKLSTGTAGVGMGDYKFLMVMALWLGGSKLVLALPIMFICSFPLIFISKKEDQFMPMGPGLVTALILLICYGSQIESLLIQLITAI